MTVDEIRELEGPSGDETEYFLQLVIDLRAYLSPRLATGVLKEQIELPQEKEK